MIFGKTKDQRQKDYNNKNKHFFLWKPTQLRDGRWAWLQYVERKVYLRNNGSRWYEYEPLKEIRSNK